MKGLRSVGFLKLLAASAFFVSASMAFGTSIKFHGGKGDPDGIPQVFIVSPDNNPDLPGGVPIDSSLEPKNIAPTADPSGTGGPNVPLGVVTPITPTTAPNIAPTMGPSGTGGASVPLGVITPSSLNTAPDSGSSIEMLSLGLVALLLFRWKMARSA